VFENLSEIKLFFEKKQRVGIKVSSDQYKRERQEQIPPFASITVLQ
jgi:hypothetical protein